MRYRAGSSTAHVEKVLIVWDNDHATRIRRVIQEYAEASSKAAPEDARPFRLKITALRMIYNRPEGMYDAELRAELLRTIMPRLVREELADVMAAVYAVVKPREEDASLRRMRDARRRQSKNGS